MTKKKVTHLSYQIINAAIQVHKTIGPGLIESVYEKCLKHELELRGHHVIQQLTVPFHYKNSTIEAKLKLDLLVDNLIVVELKAVEFLLPVH
ncbi:MAG: GxxExxY protein [Bacteroidota bacterium]